MIKICLVLWSLAGGGAERFFLYLAKHLDRSRFDITLILFSATGNYSKLLPQDIKVVDLKVMDSSGWLKPLQTICRLRKALRAIKPDLVFSTMGYTNLLCMITKSTDQLRYWLLIHEAGIIRHQLSYGSLGILKKLAYQLFCRFTSCIIFPAQAVQEDFHNYLGGDRKKYRILPTPVDLNYFDRQLEQPLNLKKWNLSKEPKIIISIGRLEAIKGFDLGIKAFAKVRETMPANYWILGQGPEDENLKKLAEELGVQKDVYFLGFQDNPFAFLREADIYLLPSYSEALPNVLIEAMYCGCPCVATPYNASAQELIQNGTTGFLANDFSEQKLAEAIKNILNDGELQKKIKIAAKEKARSFSIENIIPQYESLFQEIAHGQ